MFSGIISGIGPRYCPSIEDKIVRFSDKIFINCLLSQTADTNEYYLNGFSSSLPIQIQFEALKKIVGFENAVILQPGYAIEYDYFPPTQLFPNLMSKKITNLFFAGQVNGTTGYEEAAAQGLMAGVNAHLKLKEQEPFILKRHEAYIGVLIDDLVSKGVDEPYRMFTSRAEHRLLLRQDNADIRLTEISYNLGLADENRLKNVEKKQETIKNISKWLGSNSVEPSTINNFLEENNSKPISQKQKFSQIILRPEVSLHSLIKEKIIPNESVYEMEESFIDSLEIEIKYKSYIEREKEFAQRLDKFENLKLPQSFDYHTITNLSWEAREN